MGCIFPFLPLHMVAAGLTIEEARIVSVVSPIVAMLGPLVAGPIADKLAGRQGSNNRASTGRYLRVMIAVACMLGALFYSLLMAIPHVNRNNTTDVNEPDIKFSCDHSRAFLYKKKCNTPSTCYQWSVIKPGPIKLKNCYYNCKAITAEPWYAEQFTTQSYETTESVQQTDEYYIPGVIPIETDVPMGPASEGGTTEAVIVLFSN